MARKLRKLWDVVPIVVGALGAVGICEDELSKLGIGKKEIWHMHFAALLGSARILRKVLEIPG